MSTETAQNGAHGAGNATRTADARSRAEAYIYGIAGAGFLLAAITGFGPDLATDEVSGWPLLLHMAAAPLFIVGLTMVAIVRAERCRFGAAASATRGRMHPLRKLAFWVGLVAGFATLITMLAAMVPIFGYAAQDELTELHETSAWVLLVAIVVHFGPSLVSKGARR